MKLHDDEWRATRDLVIPWVATPNTGTSVPKGEVIPEDLRGAVQKMEQPSAPKKERRLSSEEEALMLATVADYTTRYGTPTDSAQITALLADAESLIHHYVDNRYDSERPGWVIGLICGMAHRAVQNPAGVASESFTDAYAVSWAKDATGTGVWLTNEELAMLTGAVIA